MLLPTCFLAAILWPTLATSYAVSATEAANDTRGNIFDPLAGRGLTKRADATVSLDFVQRWAAIGDSFTAGIGSGKRLGFPPVNSADWYCSRYSYTWPQMVDRYIGSGRTDFQYPACSGDRSVGIYEQARNLQGNLDVVMLTAGGNDLCLAAMIRECVLLPYHGEAACDRLILKAQENIDSILKDNIRDILDALKPKMKSNGIVVYNSYAPFFNTENEDCADPSKQRWGLPEFRSWKYWTGSGLRLTVDRRKRFNRLVSNINNAIRDVVEEYQKDSNRGYDIVFSDWSAWPAEVDGQMCSPSSDGDYPDRKQPEMHFFKGSTGVTIGPEHDGLKRRQIERTGDRWEVRVRPDESRADFYDSLLYKSPDPRAKARHKLDARAPSPPDCPGDGSFDPTLGLGLPDTFGKNFHPNEVGHETIAAFALQSLAYAKAAQLGNADDVCSIGQDDFTCWRNWSTNKGPKAFVSFERLDKNYKDFCDSVDPPDNTVNWKIEKTYHRGTPEEVQFKIQLKNDAYEFSKSQCLESFDRIINSCDGNQPGNPMNWKYGGEYKRGSYTYQINPKKDRELMTRTDGRCKGQYYGFHSGFSMRGKGWAGWDHGQETLLPSIKRCLGNGVTKWKFEYYDNPSDGDGYEWWATFNTPIWVNARCFANLKVQKGAGGYTHKWDKNIENEKYENYGCHGSG